MEYHALLEGAIEEADAAGASYAEARYGHRRARVLTAKDGAQIGSGSTESCGWSVRVLLDGYWGFAAVADLSTASIPRVVGAALAIARASATFGGPRAELAPAPPVSASVELVGDVDPFSVSLKDQAAFLTEIHGLLTAVPEIKSTAASMHAHSEVMELVTTDGGVVRQVLGLAGGGYSATAERSGYRASRSFPHHGGTDFGTGGYEYFERLNFLGNAGRIATEAVALLDASPCPTTTTTVILDPAMLGTVLHETVGHATELDRILGEDRDNFGSSFVKASDIGSFPYASPAVTVHADSTYPGGAGSYMYDAEAVAATRTPLIDRGILKAASSNRESAAEIGLPSTGAGKAWAWDRIPMARMTNLVLQPGAHTLETLIAGVDDGLYICTDASTDIDDNRELCAFGGEIGWRIRNGELTEAIDRPIIFTDSHSLLRQCDAVGSEDETWVTGILGCGKGQPWQFIFTGQGGPPARFRNVVVGTEGVAR